MGLINAIKNDIAKSGQNKAKLLYVKEKTRIRFLTELDDGYSFTFHDSFASGINALCPKELDEDNSCIYCENPDIRTRKLYAWSVYDYDAKEVKIMLYAVNQCTPVSQLLQMSENYGTITDRDYVLIKTGKQQSTTYTVIPQDKEKFRNEKALPYTRDAMLKILAKAFPYESGAASKASEDEETGSFAMLDEEMPIKNKTTKKAAKKDSDVVIDPIPIEKMEALLEKYDIDADEFCEFHNVTSLKKFSSKTPKAFKALMQQYLDSLEDNDDEEDEDLPF